MDIFGGILEYLNWLISAIDRIVDYINLTLGLE